MTVFQTPAKIDIAGAPVMEKQLKALLDEGVRELEVDMSGTGYISSIGLRVFASIQKKLSTLGGRMVLTNVSPKMMDVFEVTGFTAILNIE